MYSVLRGLGANWWHGRWLNWLSSFLWTRFRLGASLAYMRHSLTEYVS